MGNNIKVEFAQDTEKLKKQFNEVSTGLKGRFQEEGVKVKKDIDTELLKDSEPLKKFR